MKNWLYLFFGSAFAAAIILISCGAPIFPVLVGCVAAGVFSWTKFGKWAAERR